MTGENATIRSAEDSIAVARLRGVRGAMMCRIVIMLLIVLAGFASPARADEAADRQFTFAVRLMQQGEEKLATDALNEFIRKFDSDPRISDAHYYLAVLARQRGDLHEAVTNLDQVTHPVNVTPEAATMLRGQVKLESGNADAAVAELEKIDPAKLPDSETRATWGYLLGAAYESAGNLAAAAKQFDSASEADSSVRGMALLELGKVRIRLKSPTAAIEALKAATKSNLPPAAAAEATSLAADLAYDQKQYDMSADLYKQIVQRHQTTQYFKPALIGELRALYAAGQDAELVKQYDATRQLLAPEAQGEGLYLVAASHVRLEQYKPAMAELVDFFKRQDKNHPDAAEAAYLYAVCYYHTDIAGFSRWIASVQDQIPAMSHGKQIQYLRAEAAVKLNHLDEAIKFLAPVIDDPSNPYAQRALLQRASLNEKLGNVDAAASDYGLYAQRYGKDPRSVDAGRRAIDLAFSAGKFDQVAEQAQAWLMQKDIDDRTAAPVRLRLAVSLIKLHRDTGAMTVLDQLLASKVDPSILTLAHFYRGLLLASKAHAPKPGEDDSTLPALDALNKALAGELPAEQRLEATRIAARLHRIAGRDDKALALYDDLRKRQSAVSFDTPTALWAARGMADQGNYDSSLAWAQAVLERKDEKPDALAEAMYLAATAYQKLNQYDKAIDMNRRLVAFSHGYAEQGRLNLAQCLAATGRTDEAMSEYDGLINAQASKIAAAALLESALIRRDRAAALDKAGDAKSADAQREEARRRLHRVTILYDLPELGDVPVRALLALGRIEANSSNTDKARKFFEQAAKHDAVQGEPGWRTAGKAELQLLDSKLGDALFLLRKIIKDDPKSPAADYARKRLKDLGETP